MMHKWTKGRGFALLMVVVMLTGATTVFAAEDAIKAALSDLYALMAQNKTTADLDRLDVLVLENAKEKTEEESVKIFNTGVYEQGFDNVLTRDYYPEEAQSRIDQEKASQAREPLVREGNLYKAIQSLNLVRAQKETDTRLLGITRDEVAIAKARFEAGILSSADLEDAEEAIDSALLGLEKLEISISSASLEVNRQAGTDLDTVLEADAASALVLLETAFADMSNLEAWEARALAVDPSRFAKVEALRLLDMKLDIAADFLPETHSRVVELNRDRENARISLRDAEDAIRVDLRNKLNDRLTAADSLELARLDLDMAKRRQALTKTRYDAGVANKLDLLGAERSVLQAEKAERSAIAALNSREVELRVLVGLPESASETESLFSTRSVW